MGPSKYIILCSILITWVCAWFDGSAPYFPTEISRTATGRLSYYPFFAGSIVSFFFLTKEELYPWFGYFLLAVVDDVSHWGVHMIGVVIMLGSITVKVWHDPKKMIMLVSVCGIFAARILAKLLVVWGVELDMTWDIPEVIRTAKNIMFTGVCKHPELVLPVFKIGGVIQWLCFWALTELI